MLQLDANGEVTLAADALGDGSSTDNCAGVVETSPETIFDCSHIGVQMVMLTATDASGNTNTVMCSVTIEDNVDPVLTCPADVTIQTASADDCTADYNVSLSITDNCTADADLTVSASAVLVTGSTSSNTGPVSIVYNPSTLMFDFSGTDLRVGDNLITLTVEDENGNINTCDFTVSIEDTYGPVINSCPSDITIAAPAGDCVLAVNWTPPAISDPCDQFTFTASHNPLDEFPVGETTTVTYIATDASGNSTECSFDITVTGDCAADIELTPTFLIDAFAFVPGLDRDAVFFIQNIGSEATDSPVTFSISIPGNTAAITTLDPNMTTANVFGGIAVDNPDWDFLFFANTIVCTTKAGVSIPAGGLSSIGLNFEATGVPGSTFGTTGQIITGTGGDVQDDNNVSQGTFFIN